MKPEDCHYYEPKRKDFDGCPVTSFAEVAKTEHCEKCKYSGLRDREDGLSGVA